MLARTFAAGAVLGALAAAPVVASANSGNGSLTVSPKSGLASAAFSATFTDANQFVVCAAPNVTFYWDNDPGTPIGQAAFDNGGTPDGNNNCTATLSNIRPPSSDAAPGVHTVIGDDGVGDVGDAAYTIDKPPPKPSPTPTHAPSPTPKPSPSPTPGKKPSPSPKPPPQPSPTAAIPTPSTSAGPGCTTFPAVNPIPDYPLVHLAGVTGDVQTDPFQGWNEISSLGPRELLPPDLGHAGFPQVVMTLRTNALQPDLKTGRKFACALVSLGPTLSYYYVRYVFEKVQITGPASFQYDTVYYDYIPRDPGGVPGAETHGEGHYKLVAVESPGSGFAWQWVGAGVLILLGLSGTAVARRRT